ncbi:fumarylacetoacetate hydrolase family protein [Martelella soudanensis]|uniref:fumarylacetoacetate hydrolase family protein n=1 Tax=unclassified Martelella TaxID=2629616 RepID=UPI0015DF783B|nr:MULTISPECIES: fumarylacetoacetate hydrolase family protein [unclassified Martelella]
MRLLSYRTADEAPDYGVLAADGQGVVSLSSHAPSLKAFLGLDNWQEIAAGAETAPATTALADVDFLPVIPDPAKIFCVGVNYASHLKETGRDLPEKPMIFIRFAQSQMGHGRPVIRPAVSDRLDFEGELAVIIGSHLRYAPPEAALAAVAGYSCYNDCSIRDWQRHTTQFTPGKNFPSTGAFGPWMVTREAFGAIGPQKIVTRLNGEVMQDGRLDDLIFDVGQLASYMSYFCALEPGDVIITGTTGGVGAFRDPPVWMKPGDLVEVEIDGIGVLRNPVEGEAPLKSPAW